MLDWQPEAAGEEPPQSSETASAKAALVAAQLKLARSMYRLKIIERLPSDPLEFELAVAACRDAELELQAAWAYWQATQQRETPVDGPTEDPLTDVPRQRLAFARWLVQTGRLSEWMAA